MARLQDYPSITPTSADKLLVVQSQSQGLVPYGSKLDSANPTGTGSLSLNRKSGTTTGSNSTTVGTDCEASGAVSFAEGYGTKASGIRSHASGSGTIASHEAQFVFGEYNVEDATGTTTTRGQYVEIVGKGVSANARSNARTLDWSGNETLAGDLTINGNQSVEDGIKGTRDYMAKDTTVSTPLEVLQNKYSEIYSRYGSLRMAMFRIGTSTYDYGCVGYIHGANYAAFLVFGYGGGAVHIKNVNGTWSQTALS